MTEQTTVWQLTDRFIDVDFYDESNNITYQIRTPTVGRKPEISLSSELIPDGNCYKTVLTVTNMSVNQWDIRKWKYMVIDAGYRNGSKAHFEVPLLMAYIPDSPPDNHAVFSGLAVGKVNGLLDTGLLKLEFGSDKLTWRDIIYGCLAGIGATGQSAYVKVSDEVLNTEIEFQELECYAENGLAVLEWLQRELYSWGERTGHTFLVTAMNTDVRIIEVNSSSVAYGTENIVTLNYVTNVSFTAALLQLTTVWIPNLLPGGLFYMDSVFMDRTNTPNAVNPTEYIDPNNYYRVITESIAFSTTGDSTMTIKAISNMAMGGDVLDTKKALENASKEEKNEPEEEKPKVIHIGLRKKDRVGSPIYNLNIELPPMKKSILGQYTDGTVAQSMWTNMCYEVFGEEKYLDKWVDNYAKIASVCNEVFGKQCNIGTLKNWQNNFNNRKLWLVLSYCNYRYALTHKDDAVLAVLDDTVVGAYKGIDLSADTTVYIPTYMSYTQLRNFKDIYLQLALQSATQTTLLSKEDALSIYCYLEGVTNG